MGSLIEFRHQNCGEQGSPEFFGCLVSQFLLGRREIYALRIPLLAARVDFTYSRRPFLLSPDDSSFFSSSSARSLHTIRHDLAKENVLQTCSFKRA